MNQSTNAARTGRGSAPAVGTTSFAFASNKVMALLLSLLVADAPDESPTCGSGEPARAAPGSPAPGSPGYSGEAVEAVGDGLRLEV